MKTIKQKFLDSKLSIIAVLFFSLILLVTGGFAMKTTKAEDAKFDPNSFVMCTGAEARTDGASGIRFVANLGGAVLPKEADFEDDTHEVTDLTYNVMIIPNGYITKYSLKGDWYTSLKKALEDDQENKSDYIATVQTTPFVDVDGRYGTAGNQCIRGTLKNVKFDNINVEWFGMAYITYTETDTDTGRKTTKYIYAQIPEEENANVRSLVYCASGYLNMDEYSAEKNPDVNKVLTNFVAQGFNKASGETFDETTKSNQDNLQAYVKSLASVEATTNVLPEKTVAWAATMPEDVKLHVDYSTADKNYATYENGVITGVAGNGDKDMTINVTMKILGKSYTNPVHVYKVEATLENTTEEIFSWDGEIGGETFENTAALTVAATLDGEEQNVSWSSSNDSVAMVEGENIVAQFKNEYFASEDVTVWFSFSVDEETVASNECAIKVSFPVAYENAPLAYGDLFQQKFESDTSSTPVAEEKQAIDTKNLTGWTGTVSQFLKAADMETNILDKEAQTTNVNLAYGAQEAGEGKKFVVVSSDGYGYTVEATVVSYAIASWVQLNKFMTQIASETAKDTNDTYGTYYILNADITNCGRNTTLSNSTTNYFHGTFDGRGHKIKQSSTSWYTRGFFGHAIGKYGVVKNTAFIGIRKNASNTGGGLVRNLFGTIDNCYVEVRFPIDKPDEQNVLGGVCSVFNGGASITNTVAKVSHFYTPDNLANFAVFAAYGGDNVDMSTNFAVGITKKMIYSTTNSGGTNPKATNIAFDNDGLKEVIGGDLPSTYNNLYWKYTESGLSFGGGDPVLAFTTTAA